MKVFGYLACLGMFSAAYSGEIIFSEKFDSPESFTKRWVNHSSPTASRYEIKDNTLEITITPNKHKDGYIECEIPLLRRGQLDFDAVIDINSSPNRGIGLFLEFYNISSFWHDSCQDWRSYFPGPVANRMAAFNIEPVGHQSIAPFKKAEKSHYRIVFDTDRDRVEFYKDDMRDPAQIRNGVAVLGNAEYLGGRLRIGSMGICASEFQCSISNITLKTLPESQPQGDKENYLVFNGMTNNYLRIADILRENKVPEENIREYTLQVVGSTPATINKFKFDRMPGSATLENAARIILADAPAGPDGIIPDFLLSDIVRYVKEGGRLILFGGLFTLNKGEFKNTALEAILPVEIDDPFAVVGSQSPIPARPTKDYFKNIDWNDSPVVFYRHNLPLREHAETLLTADGHPLLVRGKAGKGEVWIFLGISAGPDSDKAFWSWKQWSRLVSHIIKDKK